MSQKRYEENSIKVGALEEFIINLKRDASVFIFDAPASSPPTNSQPFLLNAPKLSFFSVKFHYNYTSYEGMMRVHNFFFPSFLSNSPRPFVEKGKERIFFKGIMKQNPILH